MRQEVRFSELTINIDKSSHTVTKCNSMPILIRPTPIEEKYINAAAASRGMRPSAYVKAEIFHIAREFMKGAVKYEQSLHPEQAHKDILTRLLDDPTGSKA